MAEEEEYRLTKVQWSSLAGGVVVLGLVAFGAYHKGKVDAAGGSNGTNEAAVKTSLSSDPAQQANGPDSSQQVRSSDPAQQARIQHLKDAYLDFDQKCVQPEKQINMDDSASLAAFASSVDSAVDPIQEDTESLTKLVQSSDPADVQAAKNDPEVRSADTKCIAMSNQRSAAYQRMSQAYDYEIQELERKNAMNASKPW